MAIDDACHNLFITKHLAVTITIVFIHVESMEATIQEKTHMLGREALEVNDKKMNSNYEEPLASAQRKRWLNSIDINPAGPFCAIARE